MTNYLIAIKSAIIEKLEAIDNIKYVYQYERGDLGGFPAVSIYSAEYNPEYATTHEDLDVYIFKINLYQEITNVGAEEAEERVDNALVKIIQAFQSDFTLGGNANKVTISAQKGWTDREMMDRAATITIRAEKLNNINL